MRAYNISAFIFVLTLVALSGCAKQADPRKPIDKIQKEVVTMSVQDLESHAAAYAAAIRAKKVEIMGIQDRIQKMPIEKIFNNRAMTAKITGIGREAEALFNRYRIYASAYQEKGGDPAKVKLE